MWKRACESPLPPTSLRMKLWLASQHNNFTMTFKDVFTKSYLLDPTPSPESRLYVPLLVLFLILIILAIVVKVLPLRYDQMAKRYSATFLTSGAIGLLHLFGRYETLPWLGSRLVLLLVLSVFIIWMLINIVWALKSIPKHTKDLKKQDRYLKYLPNAKSTIK
jgi:uncharacterized membrane protein